MRYAEKSRETSSTDLDNNSRREGLAGDAAADLEAALSMWGGAPVADATEWEFGRALCKRLTDVYRQAVIAMTEIRLDQGWPQLVTGHLAALTELRSEDSRARELLVHALYRSGRDRDALDACGTGIEAAKQLGLRATSLDDLHLAVLRGELSR